MEIETDIVFLDTGIFEKENFFRGHKIKKISELSKKGVIKVKLTDITYREIKNRIRKNLLLAKTLFKNFGETINVDAKILKNDSDFDNFYPLKKLDVEAILRKLETQLDDFIKDSNIEIIDSSIANIKEVFDQYFDLKAPFGEGQKKDEFPDAFTLSTIKHWCKKHKKSAYIISTDNDIIKYDGDPLIKPLNDLAVFIDVVSRKHENEVLIETIKENIKEKFSDVEEYLIENYKDEMADAIYEMYIHDYSNLDYETPTIEEIKLKNIYFSEINKDSSKVQMTVIIFLNLPISYDNFDMASYDREDDIWFNVSSEFELLKLSAEFEFEADFGFEVDEGELINIELEDMSNLELNEVRDLEE